jgi:hypothetical protein
MRRATLIEKFNEVQQTVEQLLAQLQSSKADKFRRTSLSGAKRLSASVRATE